MKIFLSWHGPRSRAIADALNDWLQRVIQAVKPFYSPEIEKGAKWSGEIDSALEGTRFGIICLTPDNLDSTWIHYEAGALSKTKDALVWTFLHKLTAGDVPQPLGKFQHTLAEKGDTMRLLKTINARLAETGGEPLADSLLQDNFELFWPKLEELLKNAEAIPLLSSARKAGREVEMPRDERAIMNEILELVRNQERRLSGLEEVSIGSRQLLPRKKRSPDELRVSLPTEWPESVIRKFAQELALIIGAWELSIDKNEKTNKTSLRMLLNSIFTAGELNERINEVAASVGQHESLLEWELKAT
jgi:hypothetical protein